MTKRILVSLLLLALALCLSVASYLLLQNNVEKLGQALENAVYTDLPVRESYPTIEEVAAKSLRCMRILIPHQALDALTTQLDCLPLNREDPEAFRDTCLLCLSMLRELRDGQKVTWENIL